MNEWWGKEKVAFLLKLERQERSIHAKNQEKEHVGRGTERNSVQPERSEEGRIGGSEGGGKRGAVSGD